MEVARAKYVLPEKSFWILEKTLKKAFGGYLSFHNESPRGRQLPTGYHKHPARTTYLQRYLKVLGRYTLECAEGHPPRGGNGAATERRRPHYEEKTTAPSSTEGRVQGVGCRQGERGRCKQLAPGNTSYFYINVGRRARHAPTTHDSTSYGLACRTLPL